MAQGRPEKVIALVDAAREGMLSEASDASAAEVLSAYFMLLKSGIRYVLDKDQSVHNREHNRNAILGGLLDLFGLVNQGGN